MSLDTFEEALLSELRGYIAQRQTAESRKPPFYRRRRFAWIAAPVAAAVGGVIAIALSLTASSAAFAVEKAGDGDIIVTINRFDDPVGLGEALSTDGLRAIVYYDPSSPGNASQAGGNAANDSGGTAHCGGSVATERAEDGTFTLTIPTTAVVTGATLHLTLEGAEPAPASASWVTVAWTC